MTNRVARVTAAATTRWRLGCALATLGLTALALAVPTVSAHGAPEARAIDVRVLQDNTQYGDFGGEVAAPSPIVAGALDLLSLDVREAYGPGTAGLPGVWLRLVTQTDAPAGDHEVQLQFTVGGRPHHVVLATPDHETWTGTGFDSVRASTPVGDGHPKAVDLFASYATLGAAPGDALEAASATSYLAGDRGDAMPGGYYTMAGRVDLPADDSVATPYTLSGPAPLIRASADKDEVDLSVAATERVVITLTGRDDAEQFVNVTTTGPPGVATFASPSSLVLGGTPRQINLSFGLGANAAAGPVTVTATSDLGGRANVTLNLTGVAPTLDTSVHSPLLAPGESFTQVFTTEGLFAYHCHPHPWMAGNITVAPADRGAAPATHAVRMVQDDPDDTETWHFEPATLRIQQGDRVTWTNAGSVPHDVHGGVEPMDIGEAADHDTPAPGVALVAVAVLGGLFMARRRA